MTIDAHHHFWHYSPVEYDWIGDEMSAIRRDFLPSDLEAAIREAGVEGVVSVQARQSIAETEWLLSMASENDFIRGVVGWVPLQSAWLERILEPYLAHPKFKGVRHVVQGEPDGFLAGTNFNVGIDLLRVFNLVYDVLAVERQLPQVIEFVDRHPDQRFVLDHIAKPLIKDNILEPWASQMRDLARRDNVWCKLSGLVTEADYGAWTPQQLRPYFETLLGAFGPRRLMFGSDWPVCLVACDYTRWARLVRDWVAPLSSDEQASILGRTATQVYGLD